MAKNFDIELGMGRVSTDHLFRADEVRGVGELRMSISDQQLHELAQIVTQASAESKGYQELRVNAEDIEIGDRLISLCNAAVTDVLRGVDSWIIELHGGITINTPAEQPIRVLRDIS